MTKLVFSFDDGRKDNLCTAFEILVNYNIPATFNITTDFVSSLLNDVINDPEVLDLINTYADELENNPEIVNSEEGPDGPDVDIDLGPSRKPMAPPSTSDNPQMDDTDVEEEPEEENNAEQILPTPDQLNMDFTDNTQEF